MVGYQNLCENNLQNKSPEVQIGNKRKQFIYILTTEITLREFFLSIYLCIQQETCCIGKDKYTVDATPQGRLQYKHSHRKISLL